MDTWPAFRRALSYPLAFATASLPIINILTVIVSTGADTLSSDLVTHVRVVTHILSGTYQWQNFLRDSFYNGHVMFFPTLFRVGLARIAYWNAYVELFIGVGVAVLMLFLIHNALTARTHHWLKVWMWPALSILLFSLAQINQFTFGDATTPMGFSALGISVVLWSLVRYGPRWRGILLGIAAAWFACWSWGQGVVTWPLLIVSMLFVNLRARSFRRKCGHGGASPAAPSYAVRYTRSHYVAVIAAALVALSPYALLVPLSTAGGSPHTFTLLNLKFIVNAIGFPFVNDVTSDIFPAHIQAMIGAAGIEGLAVIAGFIAIAARQQFTLWRSASPGFFLVAAGLLSLWQLSIFRPGLSIWYTGIGMLFWLGMLGLAYTLFITAATLGKHRLAAMWPRPVATTIILGTVVVSIAFNHTYDRKVYFLFSRAPASAACVRQQSSAPTYCEPRVFLVDPPIAGTLYSFARQLKSFNLSVFAPNQRWTLQGDFMLNTVSVRHIPGSDPVAWVDGQTLSRKPWHDYHHLNLALPSPNAVTWTFYLPKTTRRATFHSAAALSATEPVTASTDGLTALIYAQAGSTPRAVLASLPLRSGNHAWQSIDISLRSYAGQTITLELSSSANPTAIGRSLLFRYPYIDVLLDDDPAMVEETQRIAVVNPGPGEHDLVFDLNDGSNWTARDLQRVGASGVPAWAVTGTQARLEYTRPLSACLSGYTHLYVRIAAAPEMRPRVLQWFYQLDSAPSITASQSVEIPLLPDGDMHTYTYPLRLAELDPAARLTGFTLALKSLSAGTVGDIHIADMRLLGEVVQADCR